MDNPVPFHCGFGDAGTDEHIPRFPMRAVLKGAALTEAQFRRPYRPEPRRHDRALIQTMIERIQIPLG
jgi:hypothetical protein